MAGLKNTLNKQVTRGEVLAQMVVILITTLGVVQFTHLLAAKPNQKNVTTSSSVGTRGPAGDTGSTGASGAAGTPGESGKTGVRGLAGVPGTPGASGLQGPTGSTGIPGILASAYGQLSGSSQYISIYNPDVWVPIPLTVAGPSSKMSVSTDSPATITVDNSGVCQVNVSVYFSVEDSPEGTFTPATHTLGIKVGDDAIKPVTAIYAANTGQFLLNYSDIVELSANDTVQFYISASDVEFGPFGNIVTLENGNAYVMQISN